MKTTIKSAKFETRHLFCFLFRTDMWKDLHTNAYFWKQMCYRTWKCTVCSRVRPSFRPEILQAVAVTGLSTIERGHQMDGWPLPARLCARPEVSPESNCVRTHKSSNETINRGVPCVYTCKKITYARWRSCSPCQSAVYYGNSNNVHLSCAHQRPERSHDTY